MSHFCNMLSNIRVASKAKHLETKVSNSKFCIAILDTIFKLGFIRGFTIIDKKIIKVLLKYNDGKPTIRNIKVVSTPGRRIYSTYENLKKTSNRGSGFLVVSTNKGLLTDVESINLNIGGEVVLRIW